MLTVREVAKELHLSERRVRDLLKEGKIKGHRLGRSWYIEEGEVRRVLGEPEADNPEEMLKTRILREAQAKEQTARYALHLEDLTGWLQGLGVPLLSNVPPNCWDWTNKQPIEGPEGNIDWTIAKPNLYLIKHLQDKDQVLDRRNELGDLLNKIWHANCDIYSHLVKSVEAEAMRMGLPLLTGTEKPASHMALGSVECIYWYAGNLISKGTSSLEESQFRREMNPYGEDVELGQLWYGSFNLATVKLPQLDKVQAAVVRICTELRSEELIEGIRQLRRSYNSKARALNGKLELSVKQRMFLPGPCEICQPWGGLFS